MLKRLSKLPMYTGLALYFMVTLYTAIMFFRGKSFDDFISDDTAVEDMGIRLVKCLYDFDSAYQLDANMLLVKEMTTEAVFNDLTIDNEERTMLTYLKFKDCGAHVIILESDANFVRYSLDSDAIEESREFVLYFTVNREGLIDSVEEGEFVKFIDTIY